MKEKKEIILKCILTGLVYAILTCIVQVPIGNVLLIIFGGEPDPMISFDKVPFLLFSLFIVGVIMAFFYYLYGYLFTATSKWKQGMKFGLFVLLSNYIPQVCFLDATKGIEGLITGGFSVIQVEFLDLLIIIGTSLIMVKYMPYRNHKENVNNKTSWWRCFVCGIVYAACLFLLHEIMLPLLGFGSMASGLDVSNENKFFFYSVMLAGFVLTGILVAYYAQKIENVREREGFIIAYGGLIWCAFTITMIPLGFGVLPTILFSIISFIAFIAVTIADNILHIGGPNEFK